LQSQVSGEHVQADWSRQGGRHCVIVNIAPGITVKPVESAAPRKLSTPTPEQRRVFELLGKPIPLRLDGT